MTLNSYTAATQLIKAMEEGPQFVKVVAGPKEGSVGRVVSVRSKYYSVHDYQLSIHGRRAFWVKGSELEHLLDWRGGTHYAEDRKVPHYNDLMGRKIEIGHTIIFPRGSEGSKVDMVMGTVKKISETGTIYAKLFKSSTGKHTGNLVRVGKPGSSMILDKGTVDQVLLAKLSMF